LQKGRWIMQSGVRFLNLLVRLLYGVGLTDQATCYKMFRTSDLQEMGLQCDGFQFCSETVAKVAAARWTIEEAPITYMFRGRRDGKKLTIIDGLHAALALVTGWAKASVSPSFRGRSWSHHRSYRAACTSRAAGASVVRFSAAAALLVGAIGKLSVDVTLSRFVTLLVEGVLAIWLATGFRAAASLTCATGVFALFCGYNAGSVFLRDTACGCLGQMAVSPTAMLMFDFVLGFGLCSNCLARIDGRSSGYLLVAVAMFMVSGWIMRVQS
ncbi:MAG: hypothetical protein KDA96_26510, partial [Planctomycetaceae bacterium]|nr:hypothetical protein [Planctomycetaceae bacterium]